jgi:glycosyltransferase involved in cell wall biosynthesis
MKIVHIVPGFGGTFYCGNCLRDSAIVTSLRKAGHEAVILPVYLPLVMNGRVIPDGPPVFYGAVNIYVRQQFPFLRNMPGWLHDFLNSKPVLKYAARKAGSTRAHGLESLTESMLKGMEGMQGEELKEIVNYLKNHEKPDLVHFSNALLLGMAEEIRREVKVPVVCSLQDEDVWIDAMDPGSRDKLWRLVSEKAAGTDALIAVSYYYAGVIKQKMNIPEDKIHVVPIGVDPGQYTYRQPASGSRVIGYLSRICEENGFEILVDAFIRIKSDPRFHDVRLRVTGGHTGDDKSFIRRQIKKLKRNGLLQDVEFPGDFSFPGLSDFFVGLTVLSVPVLKGEAFGLYQLESLASGVPLVQPALGAFPEIISLSGGGLIYFPNNAETLASNLMSLITDKDRLNMLSISGRKAVEEQYDCAKITQKLVSVYTSLRADQPEGSISSN